MLVTENSDKAARSQTDHAKVHWETLVRTELTGAIQTHYNDAQPALTSKKTITYTFTHVSEI
jgi:hypothetical protein